MLGRRRESFPGVRSRRGGRGGRVVSDGGSDGFVVGGVKVKTFSEGLKDFLVVLLEGVGWKKGRERERKREDPSARERNGVVELTPRFSFLHDSRLT